MLNRTPFQLEIPRRASICAKCHNELTCGMDYYSALIEDEMQGLNRQDFCSSCWETKEAFEPKSSWKSKVVSKKEDNRNLNLTRDEKILELLKSALQNDSKDSEAEAFILALYLARRRLLILRQELRQDNGDIICLYEESATEVMHGVKKIAVSLLDINKIQANVAEKLRGKKDS